MSDDDNDRLENQLTRGVAAERELAALGEAFKAVRARYVDAWMASDARDTVGREKLWVATTIVSLVETQLRQYVTDGKIAEKTLEQIRKAGEPKRLLGIPV
jgi:hypothetical protein